jgi:RNA polymerase sigma-70 factor (ECF subfamily)
VTVAQSLFAASNKARLCKDIGAGKIEENGWNKCRSMQIIVLCGTAFLAKPMNQRRLEARIQRFQSEALPHLDALLRAATRIVRSANDGEDVVQETFLKAWKYFDSYQTGTNCRAWLFRIMFNVINYTTNKKAMLNESRLDDEPAPDQGRSNVVLFDPLKEIEGREMLEELSALPYEYKSVLWLVAVEEFSYRTAAETLEVPIGTIMSRLHRGRRELRRRLLERAGDGGSSRTACSTRAT